MRHALLACGLSLSAYHAAAAGLPSQADLAAIVADVKAAELAFASTADGRTAISTGLARDPSGKVVSRFTSIWRKDADGHWRVVADQGVDETDCKSVQK